MSGPIIGPHGGYRDLKAYQLAEIIYDRTAAFTKRCIDKKSRTVDQMVQAARSGKQNIAEGARASATSKNTELRLINVARSSLEELLLDYEDFLRQNDLKLWGKDDEKAVFIRSLRHPVETPTKTDRSDRTDRTDPTDKPATSPYSTYKLYIEGKTPQTAANTLIVLIHQANYLLDQLLRRLEKDFVEKGGFTETLYRVRTQTRANKTD
ncbi:MAG: four helix bundle suffix domain-containing protein [Fimbriimonadales bacterium]